MTSWLAGLTGDWALSEAAMQPSATITRWAHSDWPRLVRGQRVTAWDREWRVTDVDARPDGEETYHLEPAEAVGARIEAERQAVAKSAAGDPAL